MRVRRLVAPGLVLSGAALIALGVVHDAAAAIVATWGCALAGYGLFGIDLEKADA